MKLIPQQEATLPLDSRPYYLKAPLGSRDVIGHVTIWYYLILHMSFPIGGPLERSLYLQLCSRYCDLSVLGVTSLKFQSHVTSSVTWPVDSP